MQLIDNYRRRFKYLRLSVTENCNFRCQYCLPDGYQPTKERGPRFLSLTEIEHVVSAFADLGVEKIRLTGGEPTLRRDFIQIVTTIKRDPRIKVIALTTNGKQLLAKAAEWRAAGITAINVSVDSLSPQRFKRITGRDCLLQILAGIDHALTLDFTRIKVNTVLLKGVNDNIDEYLCWLTDRNIELRFIELMETGDGNQIFSRYHTSGVHIEQQLIHRGWQLAPKGELAGPAKVYTHPDYKGQIGLIMPYSRDFCQTCNRLRISSTGKFHFCLFGEQGIELRDLLQAPAQRPLLKARILAGLADKPEKHYLQQHRTGLTKTLSYIGG